MAVISSDIPAGNIRLVQREGDTFILSEEQRDSAREWFYWKFKAEFAHPGVYTFRFESPNKVGTRSAAISKDKGASWQWLSKEHYASSQEFAYRCDAPEEVWFCQGIPYMQREFDHFASDFASHPDFRLGVLCKSRGGRDVELVEIGGGKTGNAILLTSRHHCQEMAATHALEGIMRAVLADDAFGREFRSRHTLYVVPFVDKDGVEDGDQGKGRIPRDHGRDYGGESIYSETAAIRNLIERVRPFLVLDLHCPWIRYGITNEESYLVESSVGRFQPEIWSLAKHLELDSIPSAPFAAKNTMRWGTGWNRESNSLDGKGIASGCAHHPFVKLAATIEIPFANFGLKTMTRCEFLSFGKSIARAVSDYSIELGARPERAEAALCFTGDVMAQMELDLGCGKSGGGYDYSPVFGKIAAHLKNAAFTVGNLETTFAGTNAEPSKLYSFNSPDEFAHAIASAGFSLLSTANNHCLDRGVEGLARTLDVLDGLGIGHTGTSRSYEEQEKPFVRNIGGIKIGFVSVTYGTNAFFNRVFLEEAQRFAVNLSMPQETLPGSVHLLSSMKKIEENVGNGSLDDGRELASIGEMIKGTRGAGAEYVIALMHSGGQYNPRPDAYTRRLAEKLVDMGADMIVGNHPHVIQQFELLQGRPVFYCLGNLITSPSESPVQKEHPESVDSVLLYPVISRGADGKVEMERCSFKIARSVETTGGITVPTPLYDLIEAATSASEREMLVKGMERSVRAFLNLGEDAKVEILPEYEIF